MAFSGSPGWLAILQIVLREVDMLWITWNKIQVRVELDIKEVFLTHHACSSVCP